MNETFDLSVLPVKPPPVQNELKRPIDERLPDINAGAMVLLISPVKTGKSTIISNLLLSDNFYRDSFDIVYIISNTIHNCVTSRFLLEQFPDTIYDNYNDGIIQNIITYQETFTKAKMPRIAIILDDILGSIGRNDAIIHLCSRYRHYNIKLLLFASQMFKGLPPVVRANASDVILGGPQPNMSELEKIAEEYSSLYEGKDNFIKLYHEATDKRYGFMYCRLHHNPTQAWRNFSDQIFVGKDAGETNNDDRRDLKKKKCQDREE